MPQFALLLCQDITYNATCSPDISRALPAYVDRITETLITDEKHVNVLQKKVKLRNAEIIHIF